MFSDLRKEIFIYSTKSKFEKHKQIFIVWHTGL